MARKDDARLTLYHPSHIIFFLHKGEEQHPFTKNHDAQAPSPVAFFYLYVHNTLRIIPKVTTLGMILKVPVSLIPDACTLKTCIRYLFGLYLST